MASSMLPISLLLLLLQALLLKPTNAIPVDELSPRIESQFYTRAKVPDFPDSPTRSTNGSPVPATATATLPNLQYPMARNSEVVIFGNTTLSSPNRTFELGFFSTNDESPKWYLGIWYALIPVPTYVWVANRGRAVNNLTSSSLEITGSGRLVVKESGNSIVWSSTNAGIGVSVELLENGNLVLLTQGGTVAWQSFDYPTDTWLPGMNLTSERGLTCWRSYIDPSPGLYSLRLRPPEYGEFELVFNGTASYWTTGNWTGNAFANVPQMTVPYIYKFHFIDPFTPTASFGFTESPLDGRLDPPLTRFQMDPSGQLRQFTWATQTWNTFWFQPEKKCRVFGMCGPFGVCNGETPRPCECDSGFQPVDESSWNLGDYSGGCRRVFNEGGACGQRDDRFDKVGVVRYVGSYSKPYRTDFDDCQDICLLLCTCIGVDYDNITGMCRVYNGSLSNLQNLSSESGFVNDFYLRVQKSATRLEKKVPIRVVLSASIVGSIVILGFVAAVVVIFIKVREKKKKREKEKVQLMSTFNLKVFSYKELDTATRGFSDKLGHGGFGAVFHGELSDSTIVAVKRLDRPGGGQKEFQAEVCTIGNIQHVNLVSDFGLAKLVVRDFSRVLATMRGTRGYMAPEWISGVAITTKADVYSYGMTLIELLAGRRNVEARQSVGGREGASETTDSLFFPPRAAQKIIEGNVREVIDNRLGCTYNIEEAERAAMVAVWCIQDAEAMRPTMGMVVKMLEGLVEVTVPPAPKLLQALVSGESFCGVKADSGIGLSNGSDFSGYNTRLSSGCSESSIGNGSSLVTEIVDDNQRSSHTLPLIFFRGSSPQLPDVNTAHMNSGGWHKQAADTCLSTSTIVFASFFIFPSEKENKHPRLRHRTDKDNFKDGLTALAIVAIIAGYSRPVKVTGFGTGQWERGECAAKRIRLVLLHPGSSFLKRVKGTLLPSAEAEFSVHEIFPHIGSIRICGQRRRNVIGCFVGHYIDMKDKYICTPEENVPVKAEASAGSSSAVLQSPTLMIDGVDDAVSSLEPAELHHAPPAFIGSSDGDYPLGMASALETLCGQAFGAGQVDMLGVYMQRSWIILFAACIAILPLYIYSAPVLKLLGQEDDIADLAGKFSIQTIPQMFSLAINFPTQKFLQAQSKVGVLAWIGFISLIAHIGILFLFIKVFGWGTGGAAAAYDISAWGMALAQVVYIVGWCTDGWKGLSWLAFKELWSFAKLSIASAVMLCLEIWYFMTIIVLTGHLDDPVIAVGSLSICMNVNGWEGMLFIGINAAISVRVSNELGSAHPRAAKYSVIITILESLLIGMIFALVILAAKDHFAIIFTESKEMQQAVSRLAFLLSVTMLLNSVQPVISGVAVGGGWQALVAYINLFCYYIVGLPLGFLLGYRTSLRVEGIWIGMIFGTLLQTLILLYIVYNTNWNKEVEQASERMRQWTGEELGDPKKWSGQENGLQTQAI
ncbi:hypothetical protein C1H46_014798 [Malus baccata]|uniref:Protein DETOXIFICATION n=1 Tax=Malus baccata TaxID=106549 RepID=A0A540MMX7_MALBA|nr:hypothetical protein C1H46_014798 [Malus baccata]